jgi:hypothetical protein
VLSPAAHESNVRLTCYYRSSIEIEKVLSRRWVDCTFKQAETPTAHSIGWMRSKCEGWRIWSDGIETIYAVYLDVTISLGLNLPFPVDINMLSNAASMSMYFICFPQFPEFFLIFNSIQVNYFPSLSRLPREFFYWAKLASFGSSGPFPTIPYSLLNRIFISRFLNRKWKYGAWSLSLLRRVLGGVCDVLIGGWAESRCWGGVMTSFLLKVCIY